MFTGGGPVDLSRTSAFLIDFFGADFTGADIFLEIVDSDLDSSGLLDFTGAGNLGTAPTILTILASSVPGTVDLSSVLSLRLYFETGAALSNDLAFDSFRTSEVPEPASLVLFGLGLTALGLGIHKKRRA